MKIERQKISTGFDGEIQYLHPRAAGNDEGKWILTIQPSRFSGFDIYYGLHMMKSVDGGNTWGRHVPCKELRRAPYGEDTEVCFINVTPVFHKKSKTFLALGVSRILKDDEAVPEPHEVFTMWSTYDEAMGDWKQARQLVIPGSEDAFYHCWCSCSQCVELENGDLLLAFYHMDKEKAKDTWKNNYSATVFRCSFDGNEIQVLEQGNTLTLDVPRGFCEPSLIDYKGEYFMCLRNDVTGYVSKSKDGLHYEKPVELAFDDGTNAGNYNTQQHWIRGGGRLYLAYTRRGADNDHMFRHRAPLFIAQFDPEKMCLIRQTEEILVPENGAGYGNFGCCNYSDDTCVVTASGERNPNMEPYGEGWEKSRVYEAYDTLYVVKLTF